MVKQAKDDQAWLHLEYYAKLSKKENPYGIICILCYKTHKPATCPHKSEVRSAVDRQTTSDSSGQFEWAKHASDGEWYGD